MPLSARPVHVALLLRVVDRPGTLHRLTGVISQHDGNIIHVDLNGDGDEATTYFEVALAGDAEELVVDLAAVPDVLEVALTPSHGRIFGKRIIVIGGGAQVGQVAMGAITEADRHNIRGERISVDTIPLVGEADLAAAVRAVIRLPRVRALVLAGSLMGGEVTRAVAEVRAHGIMVVSLNMAGSVPDAADLVVTDPIQAGVMTVMAVADTAKFDITRQRGRRY